MNELLPVNTFIALTVDFNCTLTLLRDAELKASDANNAVNSGEFSYLTATHSHHISMRYTVFTVDMVQPH